MPAFAGQFKNKSFLCLWLAQLVSQFGDRINQMALIGLIASRHPTATSAVGLAKLLSFTIIPVFIVGPIAGVYVDRWDRRVTLLVCDILRGLLVLTIPFVFISYESMVPIYAVVFLVFCLSRFYIPAKMSIIPDLVDDKDLMVANSLVSVTGMIAFVLGVAAGGFLVETLGPRGGFIWDAGTFFASGILVSFITARPHWHIDRSKIITRGKEIIRTVKKSLVEEMKEGFAYLSGKQEIRFILFMLFVLFAASGAIYVVIIVFIQEVFNSVTRDLAILAVILGVGLFTGTLLYGRLGNKRALFKTIFVCLILGGITIAVFAMVTQHTQSLAAAGGLAFLLGMIIGPVIIAAVTIVHRVCEDQMRGKVFSGVEIVVHLGFLLAMLLSAYLAEVVDRVWILTGVGIIFTLIGLLGGLLYRGEKI